MPPKLLLYAVFIGIVAYVLAGSNQAHRDVPGRATEERAMIHKMVLVQLRERVLTPKTTVRGAAHVLGGRA